MLPKLNVSRDKLYTFIYFYLRLYSFRPKTNLTIDVTYSKTINKSERNTIVHMGRKSIAVAPSTNTLSGLPSKTVLKFSEKKTMTS